MTLRILISAAALAVGTFASTLNTGGLSGVDNAYSAYSIGQGSVELGLTAKGEYGDQALHETLADRSIALRNIVLYGQDAFLAFGVTNWMDVAADLPVYEDQIRAFDHDAAGLGDLSLSLKLMHPGMKPDALIRLAYIMRATFPTGDPGLGWFPRDPQYTHVSTLNAGGAYTSRGYELNPLLAWTFDLTRLKAPEPLLVHVNFGLDALFYMPADMNIPQENSAMQGALALEWQLRRDWSLFLDLYGKSRIINVTVGNFLKVFTQDKINLAVGTKKSYHSGWSSSFAIEGDLSTQENFTRWSVDRNGGPVRNYRAQPTPTVGATMTIGFGRTGSEADPDFDGNPNSTDQCPYEPEDYDGYQDEDGCPDPVHLPSPVLIQTDTVVVVKRDTVTVVRNDTVRVAMADTLQYKSSQDPNRIFGFGKTTFPAINFKTGSDELDRNSYKILNDISLSLLNFPDVKLQVLGYTDNTGSDSTNKALSAKRAQAVINYLANRGIEPARLEPIGMGREHPLGSNNTAGGRLLNRRVEFKRVK